MIYGVTFYKDDTPMHTYTDWQFLQVGVAMVEPPLPRTNYQVVPGREGALDFTQALDGFVHYEQTNFVGKYRCIAPRERWKEIYSEILMFLHGARIKVVFDDDPAYYWEGRFTVNAPEFDKAKWDIEITGEVDPYKYYAFKPDGTWLFDPFVFDRDYAWDYKNMVVDGVQDVCISVPDMPIAPRFYTSAPMRLEYNGKTYQLPKGQSVIPGLRLYDGTYTLRVIGTGTISIDFKGGRL